MIGPIAQGVLLMSVIYFYSKAMMSMINDYYRDEFKKTVVLTSPPGSPGTYDTEQDERIVEGESKSPSIDGLSDILKEDISVNHDDRIITRISQENLHDKPDSKAFQTEKVSIKQISKQNQAKYSFLNYCENNFENCNDIEEILLLNSEEFNYENHLTENMPSSSSSSNVDKISLGKSELREKSIDGKMNLHDDDGKMPFLNPSLKNKLNYQKITNQQVVVPSKGIAKNFKTEGNSKLQINQINDKVKSSISGSCSKSSSSSGNRKINGNCNTEGMMEKVKSLPSSSSIEILNQIRTDNKMQQEKTTSQIDINKLSVQRHKDLNACRRKSVSEYIDFWSNIQL